MATRRFDIRREPNGTWTVFDVFTGWPAVVCTKVMIGMSFQQAYDMVDLLNLIFRS